MRGISIRTLAGCAAAIGCVVAPALQAQTRAIALEQVQVGLERATRLPLEIVRLQADIQADMWKDPALAQLMPDCSRLGAPKEGCSLARFQVTGAGKVFLVASPEASSSDLLPVPAGRLVLAPGSTVQLVAAGFPSIQIEIRAPADRPLYLGELASSEVGRILSLLVPQAGLSASAADVLPQGKIALRARSSPALTQIAVAKPAESAPVTMPAAVKNTSREQSLPLATASDVLLLDNMPRAVAERVEVASIAPVSTGQPLILDTMPVAVAQPTEPAGQIAEAKDVLELDAMPRAFAERIEIGPIATAPTGPLIILDTMPVAVAAPAEPRAEVAEAKDILVLDTMPVAVAAAAEAPAVVAEAKEVIMLDAMPAAVRAPVEKPVLAPVLVAAAPAPGATPALSGDLARLRAEVDAEVARENARFARQLQASPAKAFRFGT